MACIRYTAETSSKAGVSEQAQQSTRGALKIVPHREGVGELRSHESHCHIMAPLVRKWSTVERVGRGNERRVDDSARNKRRSEEQVNVGRKKRSGNESRESG